jgi:hypothetical protein
VLGEPETGRTDRKIPIENNCTDDKLHFGMPQSIGDYDDEGDESDERNAIPAASPRLRPTTDLERFDL